MLLKGTYTPLLRIAMNIYSHMAEFCPGKRNCLQVGYGRQLNGIKLRLYY